MFAHGKKITTKIALAVLVFSSFNVWANELLSLDMAALPGERFEVKLGFSEPPQQPQGYTIEKPARIVFDFPGVSNTISQKKHDLSFGNAKSAMLLSAGNRTRLVLNLTDLVEYETRVEGNSLLIQVGTKGKGEYLKVADTGVKRLAERQVAGEKGEIRDIDFRRGENGEGRIIVTLSNPKVDVDVSHSGKLITIGFDGVTLPERLKRRLDVVDFATPVQVVDATGGAAYAQLDIESHGEFDYLSYQADNEYVVSIKPLTKAEMEEKRSKFAYTGEKLSLNFQNIEVRSVLQLIADFTQLNLVASDTVSGTITLRLDSVPWDQALDLILKTKGLDKRQVGNVLMVAPAAEIAERERQELETKQQLEELAPLRTEIIRIRYADAKELFKLFGDQAASGGEDKGAGAILSGRGQVVVDERTNTIILTDTDESINQFIALVNEIDRPIPQVLIEARIVIANTDFRKELGVRWGLSAVNKPWDLAANRPNGAGITSGEQVTIGGSREGVYDSTPQAIFGGSETVTSEATNVVDLGLTAPAASLAWGVLTDRFFVDLELSALQADGHGEIVSQPKVITGDKQKASIQSGTDIPYQKATSSGATSTAFKKAVLLLEVTPQITPDNNIIMDLQVNQDSVGARDLASGIPTIDVTQLTTQVLAGNGQTVVLGGIFQNETSKAQRKVPFLGDLPVLGRLFRQNINVEERREILIFITPKILTDPLRS